MEWKNIYKGMMMGASDVVPGVSGGTIAVLLGIYDRLIFSISGIFSKEWKKHLAFLVPLGIGIAVAVLLLARIVLHLLDDYPHPTTFFFLGLIVGVLPYLFRQAEARQKFGILHIFLLIISAGLISMMVFLQPDNGSIITDRSIQTYILLFVSGIAGSAAMILPGISGSLVLLIFGMYQTVLEAINNLEIGVLATVGLGIICGILGVSKVIAYFFRHFRNGTFAVIIGLVVGSIVVIFPGLPPESIMRTLLSVVTFAMGLLVAYILGKMEYAD